MARFLAAALHGAGPGSDRLHREIERINPAKNLDIGELITASARLCRGGLERNRYDSPVTWPPDDVEGFLESARNAAPTSRLRNLLSNCPDEIGEWIDSPGTVMSYLGADFDQRRYKFYLFRDQLSALNGAVTLESMTAALHSSAYIDCLELDMETAACTRSAYWKLGAVSLHDTLGPAYRPHPEIENRILRVDGRTQVVSALEGSWPIRIATSPSSSFGDRAGYGRRPMPRNSRLPPTRSNARCSSPIGANTSTTTRIRFSPSPRLSHVAIMSRAGSSRSARSIATFTMSASATLS
jgi:hypothetical protein